MKRVIFTLLLALFAVTTTSAQKAVELTHTADQVVKHWNNQTAPHSNQETKDEYVNEKGYAFCTSQTEFYIYKPSTPKSDKCIIVLPGGGYSGVVMSKGFRIAEWLRDEGITSIVLKYRLPNYGHKEVPLEDTQAALRYAREHAAELGIDPTKVGVLGGSAGGHLAAYVSTFTPDAEKPAFAILIYPVITGDSWLGHISSYNYLLGKDRTPEEVELYSLHNRVTATTPPTLLMLSDDDPVVPSQNSMLYYKALKHYGVKATMYTFPSGGHGWAGKAGFKYEKEWHHLLLDWLDTLK
ncbi:MAG: alpha/beta hydrolase [Alistipes sp.]|nr:alpha/beta hydrolase [Alistipes sp.]